MEQTAEEMEQARQAKIEKKNSEMDLTEEEWAELRTHIKQRDEAAKVGRIACAQIRRIESIGLIRYLLKKEN